MSRVSLSGKHARAIRDELDSIGALAPSTAAALDALRRALAPSTKRTRARTAKQAQKTEKRAARSAKTVNETYPQVAAREDGLCACGCGRPLMAGDFHLHPEMDHWESKGKGRPKETVENCWMLTRLCHAARHANSPSRADWLLKRIAHCVRHGYAEQARRARNELATEADVAAAAEVMGVRHG